MFHFVFKLSLKIQGHNEDELWCNVQVHKQAFLRLQATASTLSLSFVNESKLLYTLLRISLFILVGVSDNGPDKFPRVLCNTKPTSWLLNRLFGSDSKFLEQESWYMLGPIIGCLLISLTSFLNSYHLE